MKRTVHTFFNNRWYPVLIPVFIILAAILIPILQAIAVEIWCSFFKGTVYGQVVMENGETDPEKLEDIEILWESKSFLNRGASVFTDAQGVYRFERRVPVGSYIPLTAKYETGTAGIYGVVYEGVDGIAGVRWFWGLPFSAGVPTRVDFVIPERPTRLLK